MTVNGFLQITLYLIALVLLVKPLGDYMARVHQGERTVLGRVLGPVERLIYRLIGTHPDLKDLEQDAPKPHTDFRRVYATALEQWLGFDSTPILGDRFEPLPFLRT